MCMSRNEPKKVDLDMDSICFILQYIVGKILYIDNN